MRFSAASKWLLAWNLILCPYIHAQTCKPEKKKCRKTKQCCEGLTCKKVLGKNISKCKASSYELFRSFVGDDTSTPGLGYGILMCDAGKTIAFPSYWDREFDFTRTFVQTIDYDQPSTSVVMSHRNDVLISGHEEQFGRSSDFWVGAMSGDGEVLAIANNMLNANDGEVTMWRYVGRWVETQTIQGPKGAADRFGSGATLSKDGSVMVLCAFEGNDDSSGYFQRYMSTDLGKWVKEGRQMNGNADEQICTKIAMSSDGSRIAVNNDGYFVSVFDWDDSGGWNLFQKIESPFPADKDIESYFGYSGLQMSLDGKTVIVGDETHDDSKGVVLVYEEINGTFTRTFTKKGKKSTKAGDGNIGYEAAVSGDGKTIAYPTGYNDSSTVVVYKKSGEEYKPLQIINGQIRPDRVKMNEDGSVLSFESNVVETDNGAIRVYVLE